MDQPTATGPVPVPHDTAETRCALTDAGHAVPAPAGDAPPPFVAELTVPPAVEGVR